MSFPKPRWHPMAIAVGFLTAGMVALVFAGWVLPDDFSPAGPDRGWWQGFTIATIVFVGAIVLLRHRRVPVLPWGLVALGATTAVVAYAGFQKQYQSGFPGSSSFLMIVGGSAITVGALVVCTVAPGRWRRPPLGSALWTIGALAVVVAVGTPLVVAASKWNLTATTAAPGEPAALPSEVSRVAWTAEFDGPINEVVRAGWGAVVLLKDGVVGIDGVTGDIRWSHRRTHSEALSLKGTPDGRTVLLHTRTAKEPPTAHLMETLDAFTGAVRFTQSGSYLDFPAEDHVLMTNVSAIKVNDRERTLAEFNAISLTDGSPLWTFRAPDGCRVIGYLDQYFTRGNGLLVPLGCGDREFRYVSVNALTGAVDWRYTMSLTEPPMNFNLRLLRPVDDSLVSLLLLNSSAKGVVLDTDTGTVIPSDLSLSLRPGGLAVHTDQSVNRDPTALIDIRSGRVLTTDKEVLACVKYDIYARSLSAGAVCSNPRTTGYEGVTKTGTVDLETVRFSEPGARPLTVQFDGPHTGGGGDELLTVDAIPGAVIVYSTLHPADGHRSRLFGLR